MKKLKDAAAPLSAFLENAGALEDWARAVGTWSAQGKDVYCYFDNDQAGYAAQNALTLQAMLR
jgi:uncharacterized protein YecE (DUF72 family)